MRLRKAQHTLKAFIFTTLVACVGCGSADGQGDRTPASALLAKPPATPVSRDATPEKASLASAAKVAVVADAKTPAAHQPTPIDAETVARAKELVAAGMKHYRAGNYDKAEAALKEAITLYPFVAEANLLLGKIFLLKGSALRDVSLMNSARLMFEMAHTIDPTMREAEVLLDLFKREPNE